MRFYPEILELVGAALVVAGLALVAVPAALVVAGLFLVVAANTVSGRKDRVAAVKSTTGTGRRPRRAA